MIELFAIRAMDDDGPHSALNSQHVHAISRRSVRPHFCAKLSLANNRLSDPVNESRGAARPIERSDALWAMEWHRSIFASHALRSGENCKTP